MRVISIIEQAEIINEKLHHLGLWDKTVRPPPETGASLQNLKPLLQGPQSPIKHVWRGRVFMPDQCGIQRRPACFQAFDGKVHIGRQMNSIRVKQLRVDEGNRQNQKKQQDDDPPDTLLVALN